VVSVLVTGPQGSRVQTRPSLMDFKGDKIRSAPSFGGEVKPSVPCRRFTACKRTLRALESCFVGKIQRPFLTSD
jgi:hypothetical protein